MLRISVNVKYLDIGWYYKTWPVSINIIITTTITTTTIIVIIIRTIKMKYHTKQLQNTHTLRILLPSAHSFTQYIQTKHRT